MFKREKGFFCAGLATVFSKSPESYIQPVGQETLNATGSLGQPLITLVLQLHYCGSEMEGDTESMTNQLLNGIMETKRGTSMGNYTLLGQTENCSHLCGELYFTRTHSTN